MPTTRNPTVVKSQISEDIEYFVESVSNKTFTDWYRRREFKENILKGKSYFNGPSPVPDSNSHRPSKLLRCHRYVYYHRNNAPKETKEPLGTFWFGTEFEEQVVVPFLQSVVEENQYVTNSVWIDDSVVTDEGEELTVKGVTDPVVVTADADPLIVTEVKTSSSVEYRDSPSPHHRAQLQSYLFALNNEYDHTISGLLLYWGKDSLDLKVFFEPFDREFWYDEVVPWMSEVTKYEQQGELPPAESLYGWECDYCAFRHRCGKSDKPFSDMNARGFLPLTLYPKNRVKEHLDAHDELLLTPTLAHEYPELADNVGAYPWTCPGCNSEFDWETIEPETNGDAPFCPTCLANDNMVHVSGPNPNQQ